MSTSSPARSRRLVVGVVALAAALVATAPGVAHAAPARPAGPARVLDLPAGDPAAAGPDEVDELSYDLGTTAFEPEDLPGAVELKAKVYAPATIADRAPLVILLHGRHASCANDETVLLVWPCPADVPEIPSYAGYDDLGRLLASHGMVVASIGANGVNAADGYLQDGGASARAQLVLEHLRRWKGWDASATGSPFGTRFVGHIDLTNIGLMGHSRGGEGVVSAALLNQRIGSPYGIKAVEALAPVDFGNQVLGAVPLGVILPYCDGDVSDLQGAHYYDDSRYANPGDPAPKQTTLLYGANHNFFNTVWTSGPGSFDDANWDPGIIDGASSAEPTQPCAQGGTGRLAAEDQSTAGAAIMAAFFRRFLADDTSMQRLVTGTAPFPASTSPARWAVAYHEPDRLDIERYDTVDTYRLNRFKKLAELRGLTPGTVCNPGDRFAFFELRTRKVAAQEQCGQFGGLAVVNSAGALDAGWVRTSAMIRQPLASGGTDVTGFDGVRFRVAVVLDSRNETRLKQDLSVVLEDTDGHRASVQASTLTNALYPVPAGFAPHAVLNGVRVPLSSFPGVDLTKVAAVELRFDKTAAGRLAIDDLAFTDEGTGTAVGPTAGPVVDPVVRPVCRRTAANRWGCALAQLLWGRDPDDVELGWLAAGYATASGRKAAIARIVATATTRRVRALQFAQRYTQAEVPGNDPLPYVSAAGRTYWDVADIDLIQNLAFSSANLSTTRLIIDAAYQSMVGRSADASGMAYWTPKVESRGPLDLAKSLAATSTHRGRVVDARYWQILGRAPDAGGRSYWIGKLATRGGEQALVRSLLDTESFRVTASS